MPCVTVLRHGESEYNAGNRDIKDCGITEKGRQQAATVTGNYDLVVCSPLRRARETLQHSQITYDKLIHIDEAREQRHEICDFYPEEEVVWETNTDMMHRMFKFKQILKDLCKSHDNILVVCHGILSRFLTATNVEGILERNENPNGKPVLNCERFKLEL